MPLHRATTVYGRPSVSADTEERAGQEPNNAQVNIWLIQVQGLLRGGLGYRGLIVADSLWMSPARDAGSPAEVALAALRAGNSMLLMSPDVPNASSALLRSVRTDPAVRRLVRDAVTVVLATKAWLGRTPAPSTC